MKGDIMAIDLGTTRSLGAVVSSIGKPEEVLNSDGDRTTPSVVKYEKGGGIVVGKTAARSAISEPDRVIQEFKRKMGSDHKFKIDGNEYSPEEASAEVLKIIKSDAEQREGTTITKAHITVPAYFKEPERKATKAAGKLAGFDEVTLVEEPVAGYFCELLRGKGADGYYMVFDMGGGTFDTSILKVDDADIDVVAIEGIRKLGGQDFTRRIVKWVEDDVGKMTDPQLKQELFDRAEEAKKQLSSAKSATFTFPYAGGMKNKNLSRNKFESLIEDLIEDAIEESKKALKSAGLDCSDLKELILEGGSVRIPKVKKRTEEVFGRKPKMSSKPDVAVAVGAMIKAANENNIPLYDDKGRVFERFYVNNMLAHSIGVECVDKDTNEKVNSIILNKGDELPASGKAMFSTEVDNQTNVRIRILEGESTKPKNCNVLGVDEGYLIDGIPPMKHGVPEIELRMETSDEGILKVNAEELISGKSLEVKIKRDELVDKADKRAKQKSK